MAGNGINMGVGIDLSQFQKDLSYVNKELGKVSAQQAIISLTLNIPNGSLKKEFTKAQKELRNALSDAQGVKVNGSLINLNSVKDAEKAIKQLKKELKAAQKAGNDSLTKSLSNDIAKLHNYISAVGNMSNAMAKLGLSSPKSSAINKKDRAELEKQIKLLEKKKELTRVNKNISRNERLSEERRLNNEIIKLLERKNATYASGSSKATNARINALRAENAALSSQAGLFSRLKNLASSYLSIFAIWNFIKNIVNTTKEFERQQVALEGIIGSAAKANKVFGELKQMALKSPFNIAELTSYTKQLAAYNIAVDELLPTTHKLAELSSGLGVDMSRLILAYGQVNAASVLRGQELRQFTEAGVPLVQKLADKFTALNGTLVTTGEVFDMISKRQVSFEMVSQILTDMTSEGGQFYKMQENLNDTIYGQIEKLKELWSLALKDIGNSTSGIIMNIIKRLQSIVQKLPAILDGLKFGAVVKVFESIYKYVFGLSRGANSFFRNLNKCNGAAMKLKFAMKAMAMTNLWAVAAVGVSLIAMAISNAIRKSKEWEKEVGKINETFSRDTAKMVNGFENLVAKISSAGESTKAYADAMETLKTNYKDFVNDNIIQALIEEAKAAKAAGQEYGNLAASIRASIEAKKDYERHEAIKDTAGEKLSGKLNLFDLIGGGISQLKDVQYSTSGVAYSTDAASNEYLRFYQTKSDALKENNLQTAFNNAMESFFESGETTVEELGDRLKSQLKTYKIPQDVADFVMNNIDKIFSNITKYDEWETYIKEVSILEDDPNKLIKDAFAAVPAQVTGDRYKELMGGGRDSKNYNAWGADKEYQRLYVETFDNLIKDLAGDIYEWLSNTDAYQSALGMKDNEESIYGAGKAMVAAVTEYSQTLGTRRAEEGMTDEEIKEIEELNKAEQKIFHTLRNISNAFIEAAGTYDKQATIIRDHASKMDGFGGLNLTSAEKDFVKQRTDVNDTNYKEKQNAVWEELETVQNELKQARSSGASEADKQKIPELERTEKLLNVLVSSLYYGTKLEKGGSGSKNKYERIRTTDFFDEWLSLITKAEDAIKKIVGVTGYTESLGDFVSSLSPDNFLKGFFEEGGNPFEDIFAKMTKAGITEFLPEFNQETLKNIFRDAGWEEGKEISVPDFRAMYETVVNTIGDQVIAGLKTKRDQYAKGTSERNSLEAEIDRFQEAQAKYIENMTARWDSDEIEKKLESMIKELTDINGNFEKQKSQRDMFERIGKAGSYRDAQNAIYGEGSTPLRFDRTFAARNTALSLLGAEGGQGVASTDAGQRLTNLLSGGHLNIENLNALTDIMYDLEEQAAEMDVLSKAEGSEEAKKNAKQFGDVTKSITQIIKEMVDSIISDYEDISKYRSSDMVAGDDIVNAKNDFKTANDLINNFINQRLVDITNAYNKGEIDIDEFDRQVSNTYHEADKMRIKATQDLYNTMLTNLGGQKLPDWIIALFSENNGTTGISQGGKAMNIMNAISGQGGGIESLVAMGVQKKLKKGEYDGDEDPEAAAAEAAQKIIATIKAVGSVFTIVDQAVQAAVEMGKGVIDALNATDNRLGLTKGADGAMYDKDGNLNIDEEYYEKQNRRDTAMQVMNTIGNFSSGISGAFQSFMSGDFIGAFAGVFNSITTLISDIAGTMDSQIRYQQEALVRSNENLARSMEGLEDALEDAAGIDKYDVQSQQIANLQQQKQQYDMLLALENEKKNADSAKAQEYADAAVDAQRQIDEIMDNIQDDVLGTADQLASTLTNPLVDAFRNGENAARAWRDAVKSYVSDVLKNILMTKVVAPKIQEILDQFIGDNTSSDDILSLFKDEEKVGGLVEDLNEVGTGLIDDFNNLPSSIKDLIGFNSEQSSLSGGISGITEDTARQLEGLSNSQLMQLILINRTLTQYLDAVTVSSDNNQYMANVQTHLQQINNNVALILKHVNDLRNTPSLPLHVTIV